MIKSLYKENKKIDASVLKDLVVKDIAYSGTDKRFQSNIANGCGIKCINGKLWNSLNEKIELNPVVREYLDTL